MAPSMECTFDMGASYAHPDMLKHIQCKVAKPTTSKTGKHRRAKAKLLGFDFCASKACAESQNCADSCQSCNTMQVCRITSDLNSPTDTCKTVEVEKDSTDLAASGQEENANGETLLSRGSKNHANGRCRPCHHFHTPEGCPNGVLCNFCHHVHSKAKLLDASAWSRRRSLAQGNKRSSDMMSSASLPLNDCDSLGPFDMEGAMPTEQTIKARKEFSNNENHANIFHCQAFQATVKSYSNLHDREQISQVKPEMLLFRHMVYASMQLAYNAVNPKVQEWIEFVTERTPEDLCSLLEASMPEYYED